jgi:hypothetical protein
MNPAERSTTATSPRVDCVTSAKSWFTSPPPFTSGGTGAHSACVSGSGRIGSPEPGSKMRRHTTSTRCARSNVRTGTLVGVCEHANMTAADTTASAANKKAKT